LYTKGAAGYFRTITLHEAKRREKATASRREAIGRAGFVAGTNI
jgi:hypothetical protein